MDKIKIKLYDMLLALSNAVDLVTPELFNHHQQVASLAFRLAEQIGLSKEEQRDILICGMLHDIGALSVNERLSLIENEPVTVNSHAFRGAKLLGEYRPFRPISEVIRCHHVPWGFGGGRQLHGKDVPLLSRLLYIADRTCVLIDYKSDILPQIPGILDKIRSQADERFMPQAVDALMELGGKEYVWLELAYKNPLQFMPDISSFGTTYLDIDDVVCISRIFSRVIDFRSRFTATHSAGVASVAEKLGEMAGFSQNECKMLLIAGYLHDLGKLAIKESILEKPSKLSEREYSIIRSHTFYTYQLLNTIAGFETINAWASYHHEKLDGTGYPFHLKGDSIPMGSRIMAVADVFTAVTEHRPYRKGMEKEQVIRVLGSMAKSGAICPEVVLMLVNNFGLFTELCNESQKQAFFDYEQFFRDSGPERNPLETCD